MKKLFKLLLLFTSYIYAITLDKNYNECKNQLYFANGNGVFASGKEDAKIQVSNNRMMLEKLLKKRGITSDLQIEDTLLDIKNAVVYSKGDENSKIDWLASKYHLVRQLLVEHQGSYHFFAIMNYLKNNKNNSIKPSYYKGTQAEWKKIRTKYLEVANDEIEHFLEEMSNFDIFEDPILLDHLQDYRKDIILGNAVSAVGHSQGTLYTNFAYDVLINENDMGKYYNVSAFGTIADRVASTENNMRDGSDAYVLDENDDSKYLLIFEHLPFNAKNTDIPQNKSTHIFQSYIKGNDTAPKIYNMIKKQLQENIDRPSRWSIIEESDKATKKGTSAYRVKIKYGDKIVENVLPFGSGEKDKVRYLKIKGSDKKMLIKGSCKATSIIDHTNDKPEDELIVKGRRVLYELEGVKQYIFGDMICKDTSLFEIVSQENKNTADWRVSVKNKETNETIEDIYPFNLKGSLYQLDSGEWVLASCGGKKIVDDWENKSDKQFYKLEGTDPVEYIEAKKSMKYHSFTYKYNMDKDTLPVYGSVVNGNLDLYITAYDTQGKILSDNDFECKTQDSYVLISYIFKPDYGLNVDLKAEDFITGKKSVIKKTERNKYKIKINSIKFVNGQATLRYKTHHQIIKTPYPVNPSKLFTKYNVILGTCN